MLNSKYITKKSFRIVTILLILPVFFAGSLNSKAYAESDLTSDFSNYYGYYASSMDYELPRVRYQGSLLSSSSDYRWSSDNNQLISISDNNRRFITHDASGTAHLTVTYQGSTATYAVQVKLSTYFGSTAHPRPYVTGVSQLGIGTAVHVDNLHTIPNNKPVANASVTFTYHNYQRADSTCNAVTDASGNASCSVFMPYGKFMYVTYEGDTTHTFAFSENQD